MDDKLRQLVEDPTALISGRTPTASELGRAMMERGLEDSEMLLSIATAEQLQAVLDEDVWEAPRPGESPVFNPARFAQWIEVLAELGPDEAAEKLAGMDEETVAFGLSQIAQVFDLHQVALAGWAAFLDADLDDVLAESASLELGRWVIISRGYDGWTELCDVLLSLFTDHDALLDRLLFRAEEVTNSRIIETERTAHGALSLADEMAEDAAAARDDRRAAQGFVAPADAVAFLRLAAIEDVGDDAITRAHLGRLDERPARTEAALAPAGFRAAFAGLPEDLRGPRQRELAFLANILVSAGADGQAITAQDAARLAFEVCGLGFDRGGGDLCATSLVRFFGRGWRDRKGALPPAQ